MNPAFSIVFFTVLIGASQGLVVVLAVAALAGAALREGFVANALGVALLLLVAGLAASFLHLGRKLRAWRAVLMWRTSWMSREVIVLPLFIGVVAAWWLAQRLGASTGALATLALAALLLAFALWLCTAQIYACLRFVQEWAHPLTAVNFSLIGLSSGLVLAGALAATHGDAALARKLAPWALAFTVAAGVSRVAALRRNGHLRPRSTIQSATGLHAPRVVQIAMGMTGGSFNTREFFHRASPGLFKQIKHGFVVLGFIVPALLLLAAAGGSPAAWFFALPVQALGLVAERWFFFAQARHPQNLYYQVVS